MKGLDGLCAIPATCALHSHEQFTTGITDLSRLQS